MPKLTPLQIAQERLRAAKEALELESIAADNIEKSRSKIGNEIIAIEGERKRLAVAVATGKSDAKTRAYQLAVRKVELTSELELLDIAAPDIEERLQPFVREVGEATADVFEEEVKAWGAVVAGIGAEVDSALSTLNAAMSKRDQAIKELAAKGANGNRVLAVQNTIIGEMVHRMGTPGFLLSAIANEPGLSRHLNLGGSVAAAAIKSMEASMTEMVHGLQFPHRY